MRFTPKTEEECTKFTLLPAGIYDFEVTAARNKISNAGNDMIEIELKVFHDDGSATVKDYLMEAVAYKMRHFCAAAGLMAQYDSGELDDIDCIGATGKVKLEISKCKQKPNSDECYPDKNGVKDYIVPEGGAKPASREPGSDDDIPY